MLDRKIYIKKDDKVKIVTGKDKGKIGKILKVNRKKNRVLVENVNIMKRHTKPTGKTKQGGIVEGEAAIQVSNVMLFNPAVSKGDRVGFKVLEDGRKVRYFKSNGEVVDV